MKRNANERGIRSFGDRRDNKFCKMELQASFEESHTKNYIISSDLKLFLSFKKVFFWNQVGFISLVLLETRFAENLNVIRN
jgi:hypothetical protein